MRPPENLPYLYDKTDLFYNSMELCGNFTECWLLKLLESSLTWESPRDEVVLNKPANLTSRDWTADRSAIKDDVCKYKLTDFCTLSRNKEACYFFSSLLSIILIFHWFPLWYSWLQRTFSLGRYKLLAPRALQETNSHDGIFEIRWENRNRIAPEL